MSGILLSFQLPEMLPELLYGVCLTGGVDGSSADADMWCIDLTGRSALDVEPPKRQTIRKFDPAASSPRSPYRRVAAGDTAHIWWKSRVPAEKRKLGAVTIRAVNVIEIRHGGAHVFAYARDGQGEWVRQDIDALARADGFADVAAFTAYFVPQPGDIFHGILIAW